MINYLLFPKKGIKNNKKLFHIGSLGKEMCVGMAGRGAQRNRQQVHKQ